MLAQLRPAIVALVALTFLTGGAYPLLVTAIARAAFPRQAAGSLLEKDGHVIGSRLLGQPFDAPGYFWGRPSATVDASGQVRPYNAASSVGSNLGPSNPALLDAVKARIDALRAADPENTSPIPVDLVTASGSGLDPHISLAAALFQIGRVAGTRHLAEGRLREIVAAHAEGPDLGFLGEPRVNVLELNLALDAQQ